MAKITHYYGITDAVPFEDIDVARDNRIFLDPQRVRLKGAPNPYASDALRCIDSFLTKVVSCVTSEDPSQRVQGEEMLQHFNEPWETRLGMAAKGFRGHGGAEELGSLIWEALTTDLHALIQVGVLERLEDIPLFVPGIDRDITSDISTRIMFAPLAQFTESMLEAYPELSRHRGVSNLEYQIWDVRASDWATASFSLPVAEEKPLLLVPKGWAGPNLLSSATRFYETAVLDYVQDLTSVVGSDGKVLKTRKRDLMKTTEFERGRETNIRLTLEALKKDENLIRYFRNFVAEKYDRAA